MIWPYFIIMFDKSGSVRHKLPSLFDVGHFFAEWLNAVVFSSFFRP